MNGAKVYRGLIYALGMIVLALGITIHTRTDLGVSPMISIAFCISKLTDANIGDMAFLMYVTFVVIQIGCHICMKKYKAIIMDVLQIPVTIIFTRFMNLFTLAIPDLTEKNIGIRLIALALAIIFTGIGIVLTLNVRLIPNPADGIVQVLSDLTHKKVSTIKNILDATCALITIIIGLVFMRKIIGIGLGTILAAIFVGRVVAVGNGFLKEKIMDCSGL